MFGTISRKLGPWLAALMAVLGFGVLKKRQGRKEAIHDLEEQDRKAADVVRHHAREARLDAADDKRSPHERLRAQGRLRDD